MSDTKKQPTYSDSMGQFRALLEDLPGNFRRASEDRRQGLLDFLKDWKHSLRRKHPRKPCTILVDFAVEDHAYTSFIRSIGAGGVFIETVNGFSVGQQAILTFSIPTTPKPSKIAGRIVWKNAAGFGLKFQTNQYQEEQLGKAVSAL